MSMYLIFNIKIPIVIVTSGRVFSFIFFFLFLKSILDNKKTRLTFIYFIPSLLILLVNFLNSKGIKILTFIDNQDFGRALSVLGKSANNPKGSPKAIPKPNIPCYGRL